MNRSIDIFQGEEECGEPGLENEKSFLSLSVSFLFPPPSFFSSRKEFRRKFFSAKSLNDRLGRQSSLGAGREGGMDRA